MQITIKGKASGKKYLFSPQESEMNLTLLEFLQNKELPIASSCSGKMQCRKCVDIKERLTCQLKVKDCLNQEVVFGYL